MKTLSACGALAITALAPAAAQNNPVGRIDAKVVEFLGEDARLIVGGGIGGITQPYVGSKNVKYVPEPLIILQRERFEFLGRTLGFALYERDDFKVKAIAEWRFFGHKAGDDSDFLAGMAKRKGTGELGLRAEQEFGRGQVSLAAKADVLSRHGGYEIEGRTSYELSTWLPLSVRPNAGLRYQSSSLTDYYFGVDPEEALIQQVASAPDGVPIIRPAYEVDDAFTPFIGLVARQSVHPKVAVVGGFDLSLLSGTVKDSPIVEDSNQLFAFMGLIYVFGDPTNIPSE